MLSAGEDFCHDGEVAAVSPRGSHVAVVEPCVQGTDLARRGRAPFHSSEVVPAHDFDFCLGFGLQHSAGCAQGSGFGASRWSEALTAGGRGEEPSLPYESAPSFNDLLPHRYEVDMWPFLVRYLCRTERDPLCIILHVRVVCSSSSDAVDDWAHARRNPDPVSHRRV